MNRPLVLKDEDRGLTVEAAPGAKVCLYGGRRVTGWKKDAKSFYSANLPGVKEGKWDFRCLFVNGRFCPRARLPENGSFTHLSSFDVPWMTTTGGGWKRKPTDRELTSMKYRPEDLGPWLDIRNAEITVYHMWDESLVGVSSMDKDSHTLTFAPRKFAVAAGAGKVSAGTTTVLPGPIPSAFIAANSAVVPEDTTRTCLRLVRSARACSNSRHLGPSTIRPESSTSIAACLSAVSIPGSASLIRIVMVFVPPFI